MDFLIDVKDTEDDLPSSTVTAIEQTPDGYLWIGTYSGLARFDGERFVTFYPVNTPELSHARVQGLYVDVEGTLWINTFRGGLTSYRDGVFKRERPDDDRLFDLHTTLAHSSPDQVLFVGQFGEVLRRRKTSAGTDWSAVAPPSGTRPLFQCADRNGTLWFISRDGRVILFRDGEFKDFDSKGLLDSRRAICVAADPHGLVWIGASNFLARFDNAGWEVRTPTNGEPNVGINPQLILPTRAGPLWVLDGGRFRKLAGRDWIAEATGWRGRLGWASGRAMGMNEDRAGGIWLNHYGNGLFHVTPDGRYERFTTLEGLPGDRIGAWFQSREGGIWVGIDRGGLVRLRERRFRVIGQAEGLPARSALSVCEDSEGAVWIGTGGGGLCRWQDGKLKRYTVGNHVSANFVFSVFPREDNGVWLSTAEGEDLYAFEGEEKRRAPWEVHGVKSILADRAGRVWVGTKSGLSWWSPVDRRSFGENDGLELSAVRALAEAPDGTIWAGSDSGVLYRCEPDKVAGFRSAGHLGDQPIWSVHVDSEGTVWAGTFRGGLLRFKDGNFSRITQREGLPVDVISQILEDDQGRLWFGTPQGICSMNKGELDACAAGKSSRVDCVTYGRLDGLPSLECSDGYQPACWKGRDGRLWFTTVKGVVSVNPGEMKTHSFRAPLRIEELLVDGEPIALNSKAIRIAPGRKRLEFRYTALSFEATRFRYRIEGFDKDWVEAGTRRVAQYSGLPAGAYRFRVIASDDRGHWHDAGTMLAFTVQPYFYERRGFIVLAGVAVTGIVAASVRSVAARKYRRKLALLEQQHAVERDRTRIAKDIHDDIGAGLTQITLLSELARREKDHATEHLDRISASARQLTKAMDEIVWAVDPQHDTFTGLLDYISAFAEDFLRVAGIRCRMDLPAALPALRVSAEMRYNLFLALKETLNNIVKHARATEVWLRVRIEEDSFSLIIEDDGRGLNGSLEPTSIRPDRINSGLGLNNLEQRLSSVGGSCRIESNPGQGTRVELRVAVGAAALAAS
ncbi:MAG TPA: two-component regulator propeller domain-containing protein [Verrucomicrobiae bacterium]|nr:two-component regulator propeller domain-containing protein [Verrucomicrobiae bacterium]